MEGILTLLVAILQIWFLIEVLRFRNSLREPTDKPPLECEDPKFCTRCCAVLTRGTGREYHWVNGKALAHCSNCIKGAGRIEEVCSIPKSWRDIRGGGRIIFPVFPEEERR